MRLDLVRQTLLAHLVQASESEEQTRKAGDLAALLLLVFQISSTPANGCVQRKRPSATPETKNSFMRACLTSKNIKMKVHHHIAAFNLGLHLPIVEGRVWP